MIARKWFYIVGAAAAVLVLAVAAFAAVVSRSGSSATRAAAPARGSGQHEAIKVHGQWTIEVRRRNGALVSRRQFENSLQPTGASLLARFLGRTGSPGRWAINASAGAGTSPCTSASFCEIGEADDPGTAPWLFKTLTVSAPTSGPDANKLVLSGNFVAQQAGGIVAVDTRVVPCAASNAPATPCAGGAANSNLVTAHTLSSPQSVASGQQVLITVKISFS